jgi:hypothetical protein
MHGDVFCKYRLREAVLFQDKPQSRGRLGSADRVVICRERRSSEPEHRTPLRVTR